MGTHSPSNQQIIFRDYLIVKSQVIYNGPAGNEVIVEDEGKFYVQMTNPCLIKNGLAIKPYSIPDIVYWIKATKHTETVPLFEDYPTINHYDSVGNYFWNGIWSPEIHYLHRNVDNLCGSKSYEIVMADKVTPNPNTAYLNLVHTPGVNIKLETYTTDPVHYTNAPVTYYIKVTLDDYVYRYPEEAVYYESFTVDMRNCQVSSFWIQNQEYILYTPVEKYPYPQWTSVAAAGTDTHLGVTGAAGGVNCVNYPITFTVKWINYYETKLDISDLQGNLVWNQAGSGVHDAPSFWFQSDDLIDLDTARQTYEIELTASISIADMNPIYTESQKFELKIVNDCTSDTLTRLEESFTTFDGCVSPPCNEYTYYIGEHTDNFAYLAKQAYEYTASRPLTHQRFSASW